MQQDSILHLRSTSTLRSHSQSWDELWRQSDVTEPTARAELIAHWVDTFANGSDFRAVVIRKGDRFVAALPLIQRRVGRVMDAYDLPGNDWSSAGELLLAPTEDANTLCDQLVGELSLLPRSLFWLSAIPARSSRWQKFAEALTRAHMQALYHPRYHVGWLRTDGQWQEQESKWSKNHRRNLRKARKSLQQQGEVRLDIIRPENNRELAGPLTSCFELEHASWKGRQGTSVLSNQTITDFLEKQAGQLAQWGHVEIAQLCLNDQPIAFEYALRAKKVYHSFKVSYDEQFAKFSPGQLLMLLLLQHQVASPKYQWVDCMGPINEASERWCPELRPIGRLVFAPKFTGRAFLYAYRQLLPSWRRVRDMVRA